jgi:dienelactone hydrolase
MLGRRAVSTGGAVVTLLAGVALCAVAAAAPSPPGTGAVVGDNQPDYAWDNGYASLVVSFPSRRTGTMLAGTLYAPSAALHGRLPAVVVIPPSGGVGTQGSVSYLAKYLAVDGFIALTVDPQGVGNSPMYGDNPCVSDPGRSSPDPCANVPYQQMDNFFDAGQSALDFLLGPNDPWRAHVDPRRIGATGHSEGARAATYLQDPRFDGRVRAVVALDNLTTNYCGDAGTPSQEGPAGQTGLQNVVINGQPDCLDDPNNPNGAPDDAADDPNLQVHAVAPALGLASDAQWTQDPTGLASASRDDKKTAFMAWRKAGVPSMELVLAGVNHLQFSQSSTSNETLIFRIAYYTRAWFDRWLGHDDSATVRLTSCSVPDQNGQMEGLGAFLSTNYRSAYYLPTDTGVLNDDDIQAVCSTQ